MKILLLAASFCLLPLAAAAQCWPTVSSERMFKEKWNETLMELGVSENGEVVRLYRNLETDTWSLTIVFPNGMECPMSAGKGWKKLRQIAGQDT